MNKFLCHGKVDTDWQLNIFNAQFIFKKINKTNKLITIKIHHKLLNNEQFINCIQKYFQHVH